MCRAALTVDRCRYGVALVGVQQEKAGATIQLNPGAQHVMKDSDVCFYISVTKEENSACIFTSPTASEERSTSSKEPSTAQGHLPKRAASAPNFSSPNSRWGRPENREKSDAKRREPKVERHFEGNSLKLPHQDENSFMVGFRWKVLSFQYLLCFVSTVAESQQPETEHRAGS